MTFCNNEFNQDLNHLMMILIFSIILKVSKNVSLLGFERLPFWLISPRFEAAQNTTNIESHSLAFE